MALQQKILFICIFSPCFSEKNSEDAAFPPFLPGAAADKPHGVRAVIILLSFTLLIPVFVRKMFSLFINNKHGSLVFQRVRPPTHTVERNDSLLAVFPLISPIHREISLE